MDKFLRNDHKHYFFKIIKIDKLYFVIQFHNKEITYLNMILLFICLKHFSYIKNQTFKFLKK